MALTSFRSIIASAAAVALTVSTTDALSSYLSKIPNGSSFSQELGHPDSDSSQYTDFATNFAAAGHEWTADFCAATFPGSSMTNGAAFGDPCCTWSEGGTPDFTVTAFTTSPTEATTCASSSSAAASTASSAAASTASSAAAETEAPAATTSAPATTDAPAAETTDAPAAETTDAPAAETTDAPAAETTDAPAAPASGESSSTGASETPSSPSTGGGCRAKGAGKSGWGSSTYSFRH